MLMKSNTWSFRLTKLIVITSIVFGGAQLAHASDEFTSEMSATVVKADFSDVNISVETVEKGYEVTVDVLNSGTLDAENVRVGILSSSELNVGETQHEVGILEHSTQEADRLLLWDIEKIEMGETQSLVVQYEQEAFMGEIPFFSVSVSLSVSVPVIRIVAAESYSQRNAEIATPVDYLRSFVDIQLEKFVNWFESLWSRWFE